jgi:hypothetical protein
MAQSYKRSLLVALAALAPAFTACEHVDEISAVTDTPTLALSANATPRYTQLIARSSAGTLPTHAAWEYVMPNQKGTLQIGQYRLDIPRGAVATATWFRMQLVDNGFVSVQLEAWDRTATQVTHFKAPLKLTIPYSDGDANQIDDPWSLLFAHTVGTEILELAGASVDPINKTVQGVIWHFSTWTLAKEFSPGID